MTQNPLEQQSHLSSRAAEVRHRYVERHDRHSGQQRIARRILLHAAETGEDANEGQLKEISQVGKVVRVFGVVLRNDELAHRHFVLPRKVLEGDFGCHGWKNGNL